MVVDQANGRGANTILAGNEEAASLAVIDRLPTRLNGPRQSWRLWPSNGISAATEAPSKSAARFVSRSLPNG